ncbi:MAG TPA: hypothetical protein VEZ47_10160 [Gemmatirosa sp.]|nr:hypothetical protein [Gemmatirosa sp.]
MSPVRRPLTAVAMLSLLAVQGACVTRGRKAQGPAAAQRVITVRVKNDSYLDQVLWMYVGTERQRIGTVTGNGSTTIVLPGTRVIPGQQVRIVGDPIGSNQLSSTGPLIISPGATIEFRIGVQPSQSSVFVR